MSASTQQVYGTGRMRGYTDELDWVERNILRLLEGKAATFTVTDRKVIGSRGLFNRRDVSKYEYEIRATSLDQAIVVGELAEKFVGRIS